MATLILMSSLSFMNTCDGHDFFFHNLRTSTVLYRSWLDCKRKTRDQTSSQLKVKSMQRSGTVAIRTQIQPLKPKRELTNVANSQNTKRTYGQPSEQLFTAQNPPLVFEVVQNI